MRSDGQWHLQKQKFSCVTQPFNLLNTCSYLQKQKFSCVTQPLHNRCTQEICKSRNFLVLLNILVHILDIRSAKAEIFLCYSTPNSSFRTYFSLNSTVFYKFFVYILQYRQATQVNSDIKVKVCKPVL